MKYLLIFIGLILAGFSFAQFKDVEIVQDKTFTKPILMLEESSLIAKVETKQEMTLKERDDYIAVLNKYLAGKILTINGNVRDLAVYNSLLK